MIFYSRAINEWLQRAETQFRQMWFHSVADFEPDVS